MRGALNCKSFPQPSPEETTSAISTSRGRRSKERTVPNKILRCRSARNDGASLRTEFHCVWHTWRGFSPGSLSSINRSQCSIVFYWIRLIYWSFNAAEYQNSGVNSLGSIYNILFNPAAVFRAMRIASRTLFARHTSLILSNRSA